MFKRILIMLFALALFSCESDDERRNNPNLLNIQFSRELVLSLPQYSPLQFPGNAIYDNGPGVGNDGIIVYNTGSGFVAWDASDPNMIPSNCTRLIINGIEAKNSCSNQNSYDIVTGQPFQDGLQFPLLNYRVTDTGGSIIVSN